MIIKLVKLSWDSKHNNKRFSIIFGKNVTLVLTIRYNIDNQRDYTNENIKEIIEEKKNILAKESTIYLIV